MADGSDIVALVTTKGEAEIAAELKERIKEALVPVLKIMDEAAAHGLLVQWDGLSPAPPFMKHTVVGLRLVKYY